MSDERRPGGEEPAWAARPPPHRRTSTRRLVVIVVGAVLLSGLTPALVLGAVALVHRLTLPPVEPLGVAADRVDAEVRGRDDMVRWSIETHDGGGCSIMNPDCPSVIVTTLVEAPTVEHAIARVSDAVTAAGFGDVDGSLWSEWDRGRCCYLAAVDGHEVMVQVVRSGEALPPAAGEYVEVRVSHLTSTTESYMDR